RPGARGGRTGLRRARRLQGLSRRTAGDGRGGHQIVRAARHAPDRHPCRCLLHGGGDGPGGQENGSGTMTALDGRSAIVTGAGRGTGRAIAESLAAAGASVIVADVGASIGGDGADPSPAKEVAEKIGKKAIAFTESVASPGVAKHLVEIAVKNFGGIDIVVNNAAILRDA